MKITESRLRRIIRSVIKESSVGAMGCEGQLDPKSFYFRMRMNKIKPERQVIKCSELPIGWKRVCIDVLGMQEGQFDEIDFERDHSYYHPGAPKDHPYNAIMSDPRRSHLHSADFCIRGDEVLVNMYHHKHAISFLRELADVIRRGDWNTTREEMFDREHN